MIRHLFIAAAVVALTGCAKPRPLLEDVAGRENLSAYVLQQIAGTRDGDRLDAAATLGDGLAVLTVQLHFAVGAPTRLRTGQWEWTRDGRTVRGMVAERSVMFLGGQDGPPSVGGRYDLLDPDGKPAYRINLPTTQLKVKFPLPK